MSIVIELADINKNKVLLEVLPKHEESSIIFSREAHVQLFLSGYSRPKLLVVVVRPPFPLHIAPRISQLHYLIRLVEY